jgi:hypothetical protein
MEYKALEDFAIIGSGFSKGEVVKEEALANADIEALMANGFIELTTKKVKDKE